MLYKPTKDKTIRRVPVGSLVLYTLVQRELVKSLVNHIKADFNQDAIGVLHVVIRRIKGLDTYLIVDGQHRWVAMMELGMESRLVEVEIHNSVITDQQACELFLRLNYKRNIRPWDTYDKSVKAELPFAVAITKTMERYGLRAARTGGADGAVCAVGALTSVYWMDDGVTLDKVLMMVTSAWGRTQAALEGRLLSGLALFLHHYGPLVEPKSLIPILREFVTGPGGVLAAGGGIKAMIGVPLIQGVAMEIAKLYNTHRRTKRLPPMV